MPSNHLKVVQQFLRDRREEMEMPESGLPFVTISRQTGAGSHLLCDALMKDLRAQPGDLFRGWHVFDKLICEAVAQDPELNGSLEELVKEHFETEFQDLMDSLIAGTSSHYHLYKKTFRVMTILAAIGKVIIVGRAACCVTRQFNGGIHLRLVAPEDVRTEATMKRLKVDRDEARKIMRQKETERRRMVKTFFSQDIDDPLLYDVTWNTGRVDLPAISGWVVQQIRCRAEGCE